MRILLIVLLAVVVVVSALLGLAFAGSITFGPAGEKVKKATAALEQAKSVPKAAREQIAGKKGGEIVELLEGALRAYRVAQVGGVAVAGLNIALLVLAIRRRGRGTLIAAVAAVVVGALCFALTPPKDRGDEAIFLGNSVLAASTVLAALFALLAARAGRAAPAAATAPARQF